MTIEKFLEIVKTPSNGNYFFADGLNIMIASNPSPGDCYICANRAETGEVVSNGVYPNVEAMMDDFSTNGKKLAQLIETADKLYPMYA